MAHKKGVGSSRNGRDSHSQRLGVKRFGGQLVTGGSILVRQRAEGIRRPRRALAGQRGERCVGQIRIAAARVLEKLLRTEPGLALAQFPGQPRAFALAWKCSRTGPCRPC